MSRSGQPLRAPWAGPLGLYHPGTSVVHRAPAGAKLLALLAATTTVVLVHGPASGAVALALAVGLQALARVPLHRTTRGMAGLLVTIAVVGAFQWWVAGWAAALEVSLDFLAVALLATLLTATTRADDLLDALSRAVRPLRPLGLRPETFSLAVGLLLRSIPVLIGTTLESRDAARARGLEREPRALVVPAAVRMIGHARATGDALAARGLGDDAGPTG
ncbi:energy-coupling factor transporter transmembrane component T family protein [Cellulomonas alba]|uniref:Energy-coupling factor transporter transmembrane protein EcfT n=1 Tax=Cellulomonas alba TaxID=3053467 RepID=A0ABT7SLS2_9CELL|nr:energy-coupling factor transporter transmembrane protein EcfT [Cellulomonas alba]MDM7856469.1 energy-coupling factor transporter transmembrane protein EcfT [Cellulomonas alba]